MNTLIFSKFFIELLWFFFLKLSVKFDFKLVLLALIIMVYYAFPQIFHSR